MKILGTTGAVVALAVGVIAVWQYPPLHDSVCRSGVGQHLQSICPNDDRTVPTSVAVDTVTAYRRELTSGDGPGEAWKMLTVGARQATTEAAFDRAARSLLWSDVVSVERERGKFNIFTVVHRDYSARDLSRHLLEGRVTWSDEVSMQWDGGDVDISSIGDASRVGRPLNQAFPRVTLVRSVDTYREPSTSSAVNLYPVKTSSSGDYHVGGQLTALCNTRVPGTIASSKRPADAGWWTRLPQGWIQSSALSIDTHEPTTDGPVPGIPAC